MTSEKALGVGDVLGGYQLLVPIGQGGMGKVWVARATGSGRTRAYVAVKTALADASTNPGFWELLLDEARVASLIHHPNVCGLHGLDVDRGIPYLVMDWLDGGSLRELLDGTPERRIEEPIAARIVAQAALGLQAAHGLADTDGALLNVVHRDVSPQNILLSSTGQVKLIDFGIAKARGQLHAPTETGQIRGKVSYMAPEQVINKNVDARVDIFALGAVLYEATVGQHPFSGDDTLTTLYAILEEPILPPSARRPDYPKELERIVLRALNRDVDARYPTAFELAHDLEAWLVSQGEYVGDTRVGELVKATLGKSIGDRAAKIRAAVADIESGRAHGALAAVVANAESTHSSLAHTKPSRPPTAPRGRNWPIVGAVGVAMAVALGIGVKELRSSAGAGALSAARVNAAGIGTASQTDASVVLTIRAFPSQAVLYLDEGPPLPNPYAAVLKPDSRQHLLRVVAPGYVDGYESIAFDRSREILVTLVAAPPKDAPSQAPQASPPRPGRGPRPASTTKATASAAPGDLPEVVKSPRRTLDTDNPFARP